MKITTAAVSEDSASATTEMICSIDSPYLAFLGTRTPILEGKREIIHQAGVISASGKLKTSVTYFIVKGRI